MKFSIGDRVVYTGIEDNRYLAQGTTGVIVVASREDERNGSYSLVRWNGFDQGHGDGSAEWYVHDADLVLDGDAPQGKPVDVYITALDNLIEAEIADEKTKTPKNLTKGSLTVLSHLQARGSITPAEAFATYGTLRLAARIFELREHGHQIEMTMRTDQAGHKYGRYTLTSI